jgi:flagellar biosynthesis protein FliQ
MPVDRHAPQNPDLPMLKNKIFIISSLIVTLNFTLLQNAFAYLDPGTGSYIFQVLVATFIGALFTIKMYWQKIKNFFGNLFSRKQGKWGVVPAFPGHR